MQNLKKRDSIVHLSVLAALWSVNILIVIFASPFLIYKKLRETFFKTPKSVPQTQTQKSRSYFPCRIDSKF
jgi:hypothetical protein